MSDNSSDDIYHVTCEECDLDEEYHREGTALGRKVAHYDLRGHRVDYEVQPATEHTEAHG